MHWLISVGTFVLYSEDSILLLVLTSLIVLMEKGTPPNQRSLSREDLQIYLNLSYTGLNEFIGDILICNSHCL